MTRHTHPFPPSPAGGSGNARQAGESSWEGPWDDGPWDEETQRMEAARWFVNRAADFHLRASLGALCKPRECSRCGITFLGFSDRDQLCHVCVSARP